MTRYLQRLAASVGAQPSRLRPFVEPLYAGSDNPVAAFDPLREEEIFAVPAAPSRTQPPNAAPHADAPPGEASPETRSASVEKSRASILSIELYQPLVPMPAPRSGSIGPSDIGPSDIAATSAESSVRSHAPISPLVAPTMIGGRAGPQAPDLQVETTPARSDEPRASPPWRLSPPTLDQHSRVEPARVEPRQRQSAQGSADIEIKIGRLEVIAVQPPRAAAPAAKGTSLQDYLNEVGRRRR
jgi:hypothetical protein